MDQIEFKERLSKAKAKVNFCKQDVESWESTVKERERTASGVFSSSADKEDLSFSKRRLSECINELKNAEQQLEILNNLKK